MSVEDPSLDTLTTGEVPTVEWLNLPILFFLGILFLIVYYFYTNKRNSNNVQSTYNTPSITEDRLKQAREKQQQQLDEMAKQAAEKLKMLQEQKQEEQLQRLGLSSKTKTITKPG